MGKLKNLWQKIKPNVPESITLSHAPILETKPSPEEIAFVDLSSWIKARETEILEKSSLESELGSHLQELRGFCWKLENHLVSWQEGIDFSRLRYTTVGELNAFFRDAQALLLLLKTKKPLTLRNIASYNQLMREKSQRLLEKMAEEAFAQDLFPQEFSVGNSLANPLGRLLAELQEKNGGFEQKTISSGWQKLRQFYQLYNAILLSRQKLEPLQERLQINQEHLHLAQLKLREKEQHLAFLNPGLDLEKMKQTQDKARELKSQISSVKEQIALFFSPLKKYLQQYQKAIEPDNSWIEDYLENYGVAFADDEELVILGIVRKLKLAIESNKVKVDPPEMSLVLERVDQVNSGKVRELHQEYRRLKKEWAQLEASEDNRLLFNKAEDLQYRLEHFRAESEKLQQTVKDLEEGVRHQMAVQKNAKEQFEVLARNTFGKELVIGI